MARKSVQKLQTAVIPIERIEGRILMIRGQRVILDADLATLYGVTTKRLNEQVKRNSERFPGDFMFRLTSVESDVLRSQIATSKGRGGRRHRPYAFTEHGTIMAANVLNSPKAAKVSVFVVRAFVKLREMLSTHRELAHKLEQLERKLQDHDGEILSLINAVRQLMDEPESPAKPRIGYEGERP
jgi:hypothetical protein